MKTHFIKHPCSWKPSHEARAADFPFTTHSPRDQGLCHSQPLFFPAGSPRESEFTDSTEETLAGNPASGIFLRTRPAVPAKPT